MVATHKSAISQMRGIGRIMPLTMIGFFIGSLSIIGVPFGGGTWSKWYLALGTLESDNLVLLAVLMISSLLSIAYLLVIPLRAFFSPAEENEQPLPDAPLACRIAIAITAAGCIALFVFPDPLLQLTSMIGQ